MDIDEKESINLKGILTKKLEDQNINEDLIRKLLLIMDSDNITEADFNFLLDFEDSP